jgi:uncharacterized protein
MTIKLRPPHLFRPCETRELTPLNALPVNSNWRDRALVIFARSPVAGRSKTRLIPLLGANGAACFQRALFLDVLLKAGALRPWLVSYVAITGSNSSRPPDLAGQLASFTLMHQRGADLGGRLENAFRALLRCHDYVVAIGTDSPELGLRVIRQAFQRLRSHGAVLGPCPDGGYCLIGLRRGLPSNRLKDLFQGIRWGTDCALGDSLRNLTSLGLDCVLLELIADIDRPSDFTELFERLSKKPSSRRRAPNTWKFLTRLLLFQGRNSSP